MAEHKVVNRIKSTRGILIDLVHNYKKNRDISLESDMKYLIETFRTHTKT